MYGNITLTKWHLNVLNGLIYQTDHMLFMTMWSFTCSFCVDDLLLTFWSNCQQPVMPKHKLSLLQKGACIETLLVYEHWNQQLIHTWFKPTRNQNQQNKDVYLLA